MFFSQLLMPLPWKYLSGTFCQLVDHFRIRITHQQTVSRPRNGSCYQQVFVSVVSVFPFRLKDTSSRTSKHPRSFHSARLMFRVTVLLLTSVCLQAVDLSKPIDKRIYKGTQPTCHDFNQYSATAESVALIVGFSAGQVQYLDPIKKETSKLFNEEVICVCSSVFGNMAVLFKAKTPGVIRCCPCLDALMKPQTVFSVFPATCFVVSTFFYCVC